MPADPTNASLVRRDLTPDLAIYEVRPDSGRVPAFKPGQFCTIGLPAEPVALPTGQPANPPPTGATDRVRLVRRAYSIGSSPDTTDHIELYLVRVRDGKLTPRLWSLPTGGRVYLDPSIKGEFTLDAVPDGKDLVMISTGTGLAPFMSMLRYYGTRSPRKWRRCVVIHGARISDDLGYREELETLAGNDPSIVYLPAVTREPEGSPWKGHRGRVTTLLEHDVFHRATGVQLETATSEVLLCGNPDMIESVRLMLEPRGFVTKTRQQPGNIHFERYW